MSVGDAASENHGWGGTYPFDYYTSGEESVGGWADAYDPGYPYAATTEFYGYGAAGYSGQPIPSIHTPVGNKHLGIAPYEGMGYSTKR